MFDRTMWWKRRGGSLDVKFGRAAAVQGVEPERRKARDRSYFHSFVSTIPKFPEAISRFALTCLAISFSVFTGLIPAEHATNSGAGTANFLSTVTAAPVAHTAALLTMLVILLHVGDLSRELNNTIFNALREALQLRIEETPDDFQSKFRTAQELTNKVSAKTAYRALWNSYPQEADAVRSGVRSDIGEAYSAATYSPNILNPVFGIYLQSSVVVITRWILGTTRAMLIIIIFGAGLGLILGYVSAAGCRAGFSAQIQVLPRKERAVEQCAPPRPEELGSWIRSLEDGVSPSKGTTGLAEKSRPFNVNFIRMNIIFGLGVFIVGLVTTYRLSNQLSLFMGKFRWVNNERYRARSVIELPYDTQPKDESIRFSPYGDGEIHINKRKRSLWLLLFYPLTYCAFFGLAFYIAYSLTWNTDLVSYRQNLGWAGLIENGFDTIRRFLSRFSH